MVAGSAAGAVGSRERIKQPGCLIAAERTREMAIVTLKDFYACVRDVGFVYGCRCRWDCWDWTVRRLLMMECGRNGLVWKRISI